MRIETELKNIIKDHYINKRNEIVEQERNKLIKQHEDLTNELKNDNAYITIKTLSEKIIEEYKEKIAQTKFCNLSMNFGNFLTGQPVYNSMSDNAIRKIISSELSIISQEEQKLFIDLSIAKDNLEVKELLIKNKIIK